MCVLCVLFGECPYIVGRKTIRKCITALTIPVYLPLLSCYVKIIDTIRFRAPEV